MSSVSPQRRNVTYRGYEFLIEDAEQIAAGKYATVGNWTLGQIFDHLARAYEASIDGVGFLLPWPVRIVGGFLLKGRLLNKTLPAGFKIPKGSKPRFAPEPDVDVETALEKLRKACQRCQSEKPRSLHPLFGRLERSEWDRFNLRHAELHMSFVVPVDEPSEPDQSAPEPEPATSNA